MNDLNEVLLEGRLVRDPHAKRLESGALVCTFKIASDIRYVDRKKGSFTQLTTFMLVETWRNVAETCNKYLRKGDCVRVTGKIKQSRWTTNDRIDMEKTFIAADHVEFKSRAKPVENDDAPTQVKSTDEEPDVNEQEEIEEEIINEKEE